MNTEIDELVGLLKETDVTDVKYKGWLCILGLTVTEEGRSQLTTDDFFSFLLTSLNDVQDCRLLAPLIYKCLVNMTTSYEGVHKLISCNKELISDLFTKMKDPKHKSIESMSYVVNNISSHGFLWSEGASYTFPVDQLKELLEHFFSTEPPGVGEKYRFLALVLANVTKHSSSTKVFLEDNSYLEDLFYVPLKTSESLIRRLGISLTIRNICFETGYHNKLLKDLNVLPNILLPLMGPEEYKEEEMEMLPIDCQYLEESKKREEHPSIRRALVQALCLLCYTEEGWNFLKDNGVYYITRELHTWEEDETVKEAIETLLIFLLVENYVALESAKESIQDSELVTPSKTDIIKDLPDFVMNTKFFM